MTFCRRGDLNSGLSSFSFGLLRGWESLFLPATVLVLRRAMAPLIYDPIINSSKPRHDLLACLNRSFRIPAKDDELLIICIVRMPPSVLGVAGLAPYPFIGLISQSASTWMDRFEFLLSRPTPGRSIEVKNTWLIHHRQKPFPLRSNW